MDSTLVTVCVSKQQQLASRSSKRNWKNRVSSHTEWVMITNLLV